MEQLYKPTRNIVKGYLQLDESNINVKHFLMRRYTELFPEYDKSTDSVDEYDISGITYVTWNRRGINKDIPPGVYTFVQKEHYTFLSKINLLNIDYFELKNNPAGKLSEDVNNFYTKRKDYVKVFGAHRRGSLLYGPPGNGKSLEVLHAAKRFFELNTDGIGILVNNMDEVWYLSSFRKEMPDIPLFIVLEEITNFASPSIPSKLLNMLDGSESMDNVYVVATTNHPEKLEFNVTNRPGRFGNIIEVGNPTKTLRLEFLSKFMSKKEAEVVNSMVTNEFSIAHLKEIVIYKELYDVSFVEAVKKVKSQIKLARNSFIAAEDENSVGYA